MLLLGFGQILSLVMRKTDSITVNWDPSLFFYATDSFYSEDYGRIIQSPEDWICTKTYNAPAELNQGGIGFYTSLSADLPTYDVANSGQAIFLLSPINQTSMIRGTDYGTSINVNYVHNRALILESFGFTKGAFSVNVSSIAFGGNSASLASAANYYYSLV